MDSNKLDIPTKDSVEEIDKKILWLNEQIIIFEKKVKENLNEDDNKKHAILLNCRKNVDIMRNGLQGLKIKGQDLYNDGCKQITKEFQGLLASTKCTYESAISEVQKITAPEPLTTNDHTN
jgi:hypothetical protein